ncbi:hypothetical protein T265_08396 [Opisthorchis viverrini]|uniref:Uncharacterized protein n=1 Tax=Opisthorchis viverrini TaxID=6198 RepID=A0A075A8J7_OPIVI|nr:hypothetical protein T265_08396 [Opisthorchis viverrini]KER23809.1 hypothetical protein T265_08396 [Opisthorchis viverrini]
MRAIYNSEGSDQSIAMAVHISNCPGRTLASREAADRSQSRDDDVTGAENSTAYKHDCYTNSCSHTNVRKETCDKTTSELDTAVIIRAHNHEELIQTSIITLFSLAESALR